MDAKQYEQFIKETFDRYKRKRKSDPLLSWPLYNADERIQGYLQPITADFRDTTPHYVKLLSDWRRTNPSVSPGTFEITVERTEKWLDELVIGRDDRVLFMVLELDGTPIGHIGFSEFDYEARHCKHDNLLRGVQETTPRLMEWGVAGLMRIGIYELHARRITGDVNWDNQHTLRFLERCHNSVTGKHPLYKHIYPDEERWEHEPARPGQEPGYYYTVIEFDFEKVQCLDIEDAH